MKSECQSSVFRGKLCHPNRNLSWLVCLLVFIVSQLSIKYFKEEHGRTQFGQTLKLQSAVVTMNIRSRSLKSN